MAYSTDDIKALAAILKPIIKSALESGSTGVGDLEVVTSLDSVYSLPALRMPGGIHDVVEAPPVLAAGQSSHDDDTRTMETG